jgi:hypothetical protein
LRFGGPTLKITQKTIKVLLACLDAISPVLGMDHFNAESGKARGLWLTLFLALALTGCEFDFNYEATSRGHHPTHDQLSADSNEVIKSFHHHGQPIHPFLIELFLPADSDVKPPVLAVNIAAMEKSNAFSAPVTSKDGGFQSERILQTATQPETLVFRYKRLGSLRDGTQVVLTWATSKQAGFVNSNVLLLRVEDQSWAKEESKRIISPVLHLVDLAVIPFEGSPHIEIQKNQVVIKSESQKEVILRNR